MDGLGGGADRRLAGALERGRPIQILGSASKCLAGSPPGLRLDSTEHFDTGPGRRVRGDGVRGESMAAALLASARHELRVTPRRGEPQHRTYLNAMSENLLACTRHRSARYLRRAPLEHSRR
jgi:hypothetical protein